VKDTKAPNISRDANADVTVTLDYQLQADIVADESNVTAKLLENLTATDHNSIDQDLDPVSDRSKWNVSINKQDGSSYVPSTVYPTDRNDEGYNVVITVTDQSGNTSDTFTRELKVGDYTAPAFTMLGDKTIHDFYRYGKNNTSIDINNSQLLHADQLNDPNAQTFNGTGFSNGAHRLVLADYNFIDPGIYAEDASFSLDEYPDFDGDGLGEAHALKQVSENDFEDTDNLESGIIYTYSTLHTKQPHGKTLKQLQDDLAAGTAVVEGSTVPLPDLEGAGFKFADPDKNSTTMNVSVTKLEIRYRVKDGWDNIKDDNRTVYIYESQQFADFAFYATPLKNILSGDMNGSSLDSLNAAQKDYDGDGVSDFWELALGTKPNDASDVPSGLDDPTTFQNLNINTLKSNMQKISGTAEYAALQGFVDFLDFNGTSPNP